MTDLVSKATWQSSLDASAYTAGAEEMTAASDEAAAAVTRLDVSTQKVGKSAVLTEAGWRRFAESMDPATRQSNRLAAQMEKLTLYTNAGFVGAEKDVGLRVQQAVAARSLGVGLSGLAINFEKTAVATEKAGQAGHGALRYYRELFDEVSSGRTRYLPSTLATLLTQFYHINFATLAWGAALLGIPAAMAIAAVSVENELDRITRGIEASGFAAGVTTDKIEKIGQALAKTNDISIRSGMDIASALAARGNVGPGLLPSATLAAADYGRAAGIAADKVGAEFEKILSDPAKGAKELAADFDLLSPKVVRHIQDLEEQGRAAEAQKIIIDAVTNRMGTLEDKSWSLAKVFDGAATWISNVWHNTGTVMSGGTLQDQLAAKEFRLANLQRLPINTSQERAEVAQLQKEISDLLAKSIAQGIDSAKGAARKQWEDYYNYVQTISDKLNPYSAQMREMNNRETGLIGGDWKAGMPVPPVEQWKAVELHTLSTKQAAEELKLIEAERARILRQQTSLLDAQGKDYRKSAEELAKAEDKLAGITAKTANKQVSDRISITAHPLAQYEKIIGKLEDQNNLAGLYGEALKEQQVILEAQDAMGHKLTDNEKAKLQLLVRQNDSLSQQAEAYKTIEGQFSNFYNSLLHGKPDLKSLVSGLYGDITKPLSDNLAKGTMSLIFGHGTGAPKGTSTDPLFVVMSGASGLFSGQGAGGQAGGVFGSGNGLMGLFNKGSLFGSGGFISNLLHGGGGAGSFSSFLLNTFSGFFADGGNVPPGQWGIAGENGPEPVFGGSTGATVVPYGAPKYNAVNDNSVSHSIAFHIDARGSNMSEDQFRQIVRQEVTPMLHHTYAKSVHDSVQAVSARSYAKGRGPI